jgi:hypothetical protein
MLLMPAWALEIFPNLREPISRISIHSRTPPAVRLGTGVNRFTPGPLVTPGPRGGSPEVCPAARREGSGSESKFC